MSAPKQDSATDQESLVRKEPPPLAGELFDGNRWRCELKRDVPHSVLGSWMFNLVFVLVGLLFGAIWNSFAVFGIILICLLALAWTLKTLNRIRIEMTSTHVRITQTHLGPLGSWQMAASRIVDFEVIETSFTPAGSKVPRPFWEVVAVYRKDRETLSPQHLNLVFQESSRAEQTKTRLLWILQQSRMQTLPALR